MFRWCVWVMAAAVTMTPWGCGESEDHGHAHGPSGEHVHADGSKHAGHAPDAKHGEDEHEHEEHPLGKFDIDGVGIEAAQGHGPVEAGKEAHLVVKLSYNDKGATIVRAWIGSKDRTLSSVGKGEYAPSHDDYDVHAVAPDPLPDGAKWWVEIEKPDGKKHVGSFPYLTEVPKP